MLHAFRPCGLVVLSIVFLATGFASDALAQPLGKRLAPKVQVGKEVLLSIGTHKKATKFKIVEGPDSASITLDKGLFKWQPTEKEIGRQTFAIEFRVNGKKRRVTMATEVVRELKPEMDAASKPPSVTKNEGVSDPFGNEDSSSPVLAFNKLPTPMEVSCLAMTEDGYFVLLGHQASNQVTVWSVVKDSIVTTLDCPSPGDILCRGDRAFVANVGEGTISIVDTISWKISGELQTPSADQVFLTAPQGRYFKGQILLNAMVDRQVKLYAVDTIKDRYHDIHDSRDRVPTESSYSGKFCITQSGVMSHIEIKGPFDSIVAGDPIRDLKLGINYDRCPQMRQVRDGEFWFGRNQVYRGSPPKLMHEAKAEMVIPDLHRDCYYAVDSTKVTGHAIDGTNSDLGRVLVKFPSEYSRMGKNPRRTNE